jgi:hypothetical protein
VPLVDRCRGVCSPVAPVAACAIWAYESVRAPTKPAPRVNVEKRIEGKTPREESPSLSADYAEGFRPDS